MEKPEVLYLTNMVAGRKIYTFEIKQSPYGNSHLLITEESDSEKVILIISEEYLPVFTAMLHAATVFLTEYNNIGSIIHKTNFNKNSSEQKAYTLEEKRKEHAMAYAKWTQDDDDKLRKLFENGKTIEELSRVFQRNQGAIRSSLNKLGLVR